LVHDHKQLLQLVHSLLFSPLVHQTQSSPYCSNESTKGDAESVISAALRTSYSRQAI